MKIKAILTMLIMLGGACMYALPDTADAARLGGGRSFGSRPSMSQPAQAPSAMQRQSTQQRQQAAQAQQPQRKGFLGGMGGLLGGLLAGSLIGSLLFGGGFSGGGIMDILLLGILLFVGLKLFARARSKAQPAPAGAGNAPMGGMEPPLQRNDTAASGWDTLSGQNNAYNSQPEVVIPMPKNSCAAPRWPTTASRLPGTAVISTISPSSPARPSWTPCVSSWPKRPNPARPRSCWSTPSS